MNERIKKAIDYIKVSRIYGDLYEHVSADSKFSELPFLNSSYIKNFKIDNNSKSYTTYFSSGTTSKPKAIVYTKNDFKVINNYLKWFNIVEGIENKEKVMVFMDQFFWGIGHLTYCGHVFAGNCVIPVDTDLPKSAIELIVESTKPTVISSLPSMLIQNKDVLACNSVKLIETTGEMLTIEDRKIIQDSYHAEVYDSYGLTESLIGVECSEHGGYHYLKEFVKLDIIDKKGNLLPDGGIGELIVTSFFHELMPIIKYRTGDICCLINQPCKCGLASPRVRFLGRIEKGYALDEGYEFLHKDLLQIVRSVDPNIKIKNVIVKKEQGIYNLIMELSKMNCLYKNKIEEKVSSFNQEMAFMVKRKKLKITINPIKIKLPRLSSEVSMEATLEKQFVKIRNKYQLIEIVQIKEFGKCLLIDGFMQGAETDHEIYDDKLILNLSEKDSNILILGGGDGFIASTILKRHPNIKKIDIVDIDKDVIASCNKFFERPAFFGEKVKYHIEDAIKFLESNQEQKYSAIIFDLTDVPVGAHENMKYFFERLAGLTKNIISPSGWISVYAGSPTVTEKYFNTKEYIIELFKRNYGNINQHNVFVPSFGEEAAIITIKK